MKVTKRLNLLFVSLLASSLAACGGKHSSSEEHGAEEHAHEKGEDDGHGHGEESPSGASFKPGKGIIITPESQKLLGIATTDVVEKTVPRDVRLNVQVFSENHVPSTIAGDHSGCDVIASGLVSSNDAVSLAAGQSVKFLLGTNLLAAGAVLKIQKILALGDVEVIVGASNAAPAIAPGSFVSASISVPREQPVTVIPLSAVLRSAEGTFAYALNGDAYLRTAIVLGSASVGLVEVVDGLLSGDVVVTHPVETLWLIELRATKGGGHSH
jgi:hypothetical protein